MTRSKAWRYGARANALHDVEALCVNLWRTIADGRGAFEATSIWHGRDGRLEHVLTIPFPDSVGLFYSEFTEFLGFHRNSDEWKVMGLAPYGEPGVDLRAFIDVETGSDSEPCRVHSGMLMPRAVQFPE